MKVFISATTCEFKPCRDAIASDLRAAGATEVKVQEDFQQGPGTLLKKLEAYVSRCDRVILLLGRHYGAEPSQAEAGAGRPRRSYTQWEYYFAIGERLNGTTAARKAIFVYQALPEFFGGAPDKQDPAEAELQCAFVERVLASGKDRQTFTTPDQLQRLVLRDCTRVHRLEARPNNLPFASLGSLFKGREEFLQQIREILGIPGRAAAITSSQTAAVYGLGGIGKTRAAIEYARAQADEFTALLFVRADSPDSLQTSLAALCAAAVLNLPEQEARETEVRVHAVLRWLEAHPGWLLIFDNVDTEDAAQAVEDFLPRLSPHGQVLITSRLSRWMGSITPLAMGLLTPDASTDYLLAATPHRRKSTTDPTDARALAEALDRFPLALTQAAAYINVHDLTFAGYLQEWESKRSEVMSWYDARLMQYPVSVAVTWQTSFDQLSEPARDLLRLLAWLAPNPIPEFLLETEAPGIGEGVPITTQAMRAVLVELKKYSLATRDSNAPEFTVHRLVQEVTRIGMAEEERRSFLGRALAWVNAAFVGDPQNVRSWPVLNPLLPHAISVVERVDRDSIKMPLSHLMSQCGLLLHVKAQYVLAGRLYQRALAINEILNGPVHPTVATSLNNLAALLQDTNHLPEAEPLYRRALAVDEAIYGCLHPSVARDLNNVATLLQETKRTSEAELLYRRALAIDESIHGPQHSEVAIDLNNLAQLLQATERFSEAELMMRRALAITEANDGPDHPRVAMCLNNLGGLLQTTKHLGEAESMMRRALAIIELNYGPDHLDAATCLNNVAQLLQATDRLFEAEPMMRRLLSIFLKFMRATGFRHPRLLDAAKNYTTLLMQMGYSEVAAVATVREIAPELIRINPPTPNDLSANS
jgi:tetratricopeptide (TPR) repeat protein